MKKIALYFLCWIFLFSVSPVSGQIGFMPEQESKNNIIFSTNGYDNSMFTSSIGFCKGLFVEKLNRPLLLSVNIAFPIGNFDLKDFRFTFGTQLNLYGDQTFKLPMELNFILKGTSNGTFKSTGFANELIIVPGYYEQKWLIAAEIGWTQHWFSTIKHTDFYRTYFYQDAKDGWLANPSSELKAGIRAGIFIQERLDLLLRVSYKTKGKYENLAPPLFAVLSVGYRF